MLGVAWVGRVGRDVMVLEWRNSKDSCYSGPAPLADAACALVDQQIFQDGVDGLDGEVTLMKIF